MMERLSAWLEEMLELERINKAELARRLGIGPWMIGRWIKGEDKPKFENCAKLAEYYDIPLHAVLAMAGYAEEEGEEVVDAIERSRSVVLAKLLARFGSARAVSGIELPVLGPVSAGLPEAVEEDLKRTLRVPSGVLWEASGDCLQDLGVESDDLVLIDPKARDPKPGQIVMVRLADGTTTLKRFQPAENGTVRLEPANANGPYKTITTRNIEILGTAKWRLKSI